MSALHPSLRGTAFRRGARAPFPSSCSGWWSSIRGVHPSPCWDDIWDSNITGILQKKTLWFIWRCWSKTVVDPLLRKIWDPPLNLLIYSYEENPLGVPNFSLVFSVRKQTRMYYWVAKTCLISLRSLQNVCMGDCIKTLTQHLLRCSPSL